MRRVYRSAEDVVTYAQLASLGTEKIAEQITPLPFRNR